MKSPKVDNEIDVYIDCEEIISETDEAPEDQCFFKYNIEILGSGTTGSIISKGQVNISIPFMFPKTCYNYYDFL